MLGEWGFFNMGILFVNFNNSLLIESPCVVLVNDIKLEKRMV